MVDVDKEIEIQWVKHGSGATPSILGKDILVSSSGNFISFVETSRMDKKEILYNANTEVRGDGVQCVCTHGSLPCFAFAERCRNPRIFIMSFPSFEVIKNFDSVTDTNYLAIKFSEMEFLIALTGIPDFKLVIWNWRTADKIYTQETKLDSPKQILKVSPTSPIQILQSTGEDGRLVCWDLNICYKKTLLNRKFVQLPETTTPPYSFTFGADGDIYFVDSTGSLYSVNSETLVCNEQYIFPGNNSALTSSTSYIPCVTWYKGGIVFSTPTEVIFYRRKSSEGWGKVWSCSPRLHLKDLLTSCIKDLLIGITITNEVIIFKGETQVECSNLKSTGTDFEFACFVNPVGDHIITFGNAMRSFCVWNKSNGQKVYQHTWIGGVIKDVKSNPRMPYLVSATQEGNVNVLSAYDPTNLLDLDQTTLTDNCLNAIKFSVHGEAFCVANMDIGEFFLMRLPAKLEVVAYLMLQLKIVDFVVMGREVAGVSLIVVPMSQFCCRSGQTALLYAVNERRKALEHIRDVPIPYVVTGILLAPTSHREIICVIHRSRKCFVMNFLDGKVLQEFVTGHQMKLISILSEGEHLATFGADGLVIVKTASSKRCAALFLTQHRLTRGVKALTFDAYMNYVGVLGANGSLVCVRLKHFRRDDLKQALTSAMSSPEYRHLFLPTIHSHSRYSTAVSMADSERSSSTAASRLKRVNWLILRQMEMMSLEEQDSKKEKESILEEFNMIKAKLSDLMDANSESVPERQLPIQAFDLDKATRRKKLEDAKAEREKERLFRQARMKSLAKLTELIKSICWDTMAVKGREIHGIAALISVQSYPLLPEPKDFKETMIWLGEAKKLMQFFKTGDCFEPWVPRTDSALELHINTKFQVSALDVTQTIKTKYEEEQMEDEKMETESEEQESQYVWSGTSTHNFIEVDPLHYSQFELTTFLQSHQEIHFIENDIKKLMLWFNKEFAETFALKEQEMAFVLERNNRFRHIIQELSFFNFSPAICKTTIYDPEWAPEENPEKILSVEDSEVKVPMYISQSELDLIRQKLEEEEKLRLLMADDFRERALITMMDGVLEKLWEDEIKKDIPKPKCMLEKDAELMTDEDQKAVRIYEDAVKFLASERERYRKILEGQWNKTLINVRDNISRFDEKVFKLHILKLKVESAMGQEILKSLRIRNHCFERIEFGRRVDAVKINISKNEKKIEAMSAELTKLMEMTNECRSAYEALQIKDKNLDRNFKKEFPEYSAIACEQLYKLSKKRPKLLQRAATFSTVLIDLGKCALSGIKPEYMPTECIQYLRDIDALDSYANCPPAFSQQAWETACKLRRIKIDTELKIRACGVDLADAEATVAYYQKMIKTAKENQVQLQNELHSIRMESINTSLNQQIQLVLKKGLVEIPLTGQLTDFDESILVTKDILNDINRAIHKIGQQKIKAMQRAANFRKGIIYKEWEHKKLRMEIEDLKGKLETIEKFQVLKELQAILVARARGFSDEKGFLYLENELAKVKEKYEKAKVDIHSKIEKYNVKIEKINKKNKHLDLQIMELNVEVNEMNLSRDVEFDQKFLEENMKRMKRVRERSRLVRKIQEQHNEILVLQTELELLRLRTYPAIKQKIS